MAALWPQTGDFSAFLEQMLYCESLLEKSFRNCDFSEGDWIGQTTSRKWKQMKTKVWRWQ